MKPHVGGFLPTQNNMNIIFINFALNRLTQN
jgi:hypothetical protein